MMDGESGVSPNFQLLLLEGVVACSKYMVAKRCLNKRLFDDGWVMRWMESVASSE